MERNNKGRIRRRDHVGGVMTYKRCRVKRCAPHQCYRKYTSKGDYKKYTWINRGDKYMEDRCVELCSTPRFFDISEEDITAELFVELI